jgi:ubiquitin-protein ligase
MAIKFPENYPFKAPQFIFTTKIFHPNINEDGTLCEDMIETKVLNITQN